LGFHTGHLSRKLSAMNCRLAKLLLPALALFLFGFSAGHAVEAADFFSDGPIAHLQITIPPDGISQLRTNAREYVKATVREGTNNWTAVGIHLKGSIGSFRNLEGKPAFTLSFDRFIPGQRFYRQRKIHLNNAVEDPSYMNELIGGELFRRAGIPAPRATHALAELNGRPLGLYVLKEAFTEDFLAQYFRHPDGNLYDIAREGHDVNELMEKDFGKGPTDRSDLESLAAAALEPDFRRRQERFARTLDVDRFLSFMAMEILVGHRDGYSLARNNFRVYQDVDSGRMVFLPHGMDQLFGNPRSTIYPKMNGLVARALMDLPENRIAYRQRCALLTTNVLRPEKINQYLDRALSHLRSAVDLEMAANLDREARALKERIASRFAQVEKQLEQGPLELLRFENHVATAFDWKPVDIPEGGDLTETTLTDSRPALVIRAGPVTSASWRARVLLPRGRYQLEGAIKTENVERLKFGKNHGAILKVPAATSARTEPMLGTRPWRVVQVPFEIAEREKEIELICELRAAKGTAWFDRNSLRLIRIER
jgi:hypothetical protein